MSMKAAVKTTQVDQRGWDNYMKREGMARHLLNQQLLHFLTKKASVGCGAGQVSD